MSGRGRGRGGVCERTFENCRKEDGRTAGRRLVEMDTRGAELLLAGPIRRHARFSSLASLLAARRFVGYVFDGAVHDPGRGEKPCKIGYHSSSVRRGPGEGGWAKLNQCHKGSCIYGHILGGKHIDQIFRMLKNVIDLLVNWSLMH